MAVAVIAAIGLFASLDFTRAQSASSAPREIDFSAFILNKENKQIKNGDYDIHFAIYTSDRKNTDASLGSNVWEETQTITIINGNLSAFLGAKNPLPADFDFSSQNYYLGIRMGTDSEMVPRKRIGAVPLSLNSYSLQGATIGTDSGNIPTLGSGGKLDTTLIPTITKLGTISTGTWQADVLAPKYGGTGISSYATGDLTYASASSTISKLAVGNEGQFLTVTNGLPAWGTIDLSYSQNVSNIDDTLIIADSNADGIGNILFKTRNEIRMEIINNGNVGIGTETPTHKLDVNGDTNINGTLYATALIISGQATIGTLGLNLYSNTSFIPSTEGLNLGSATHHWANLYADNLAVGTLDVQNANVSGTSSQYFTLNTAAIDETNMGIRFYRGPDINGYASLIWNGTDQKFNLYKRESTGDLADLNVNTVLADKSIKIGSNVSSNNVTQSLDFSPQTNYFYGYSISNITGSLVISNDSNNPGTLSVGTNGVTTIANGSGNSTLNDMHDTLVLSDNGVSGTYYRSDAVFRIGRWDTNGTDSKSRLDIAVRDGGYPTTYTTALTALSNGNVGIGTTNTQNIRLAVYDNVSGGIYINETGPYGYGIIATAVNGNGVSGATAGGSGVAGVLGTVTGAGGEGIYGIDYNGTGYAVFGISYNGGYAASFQGKGELHDSSWHYTSDRRLKENIKYFDDQNLNALNLIGQLRPASFDYINGEKNTEGFIAQDVQTVLPNLVSADHNGMLTLETTNLIPYMIKGTQEQQVEIETLQKNNQDLQARNDNMQKEIDVLQAAIAHPRK